MKKFCIILVFTLLIFCLDVPCFAAEVPSEERQLIFYEEKALEDGITQITTVTVSESPARAGTKTAIRKDVFENGSTEIAIIQLTGTFTFNGSTVSVVSKSISRCETYAGWNFQQSAFTSSGGTIRLTGKLTKLIVLNYNVEMTLSCDKDGNISY